MTYFLLIPALLFLGWQVSYLRELRKHDEHLFRFCKLRRDMIEYIYENQDSFSTEDYSAVRRTLQVLNDTIRIYKHHKTVMFDFRAFSKYLGEAEKASGAIERINSDNPEITGFLRRFNIAVVKAFIAYTPFLRHEWAVRTLLASLKALSSVGNSKIKHMITRINQATTLVNDSMELIKQQRDHDCYN